LMSTDNPSPAPKRTASVHRHIEKYGSGEPYSPDVAQTYKLAVRLSSPIFARFGVAEATQTRTFGTDFWHAVEFSRDGCAPAGVSRPVSGQPSHAMSATSRCQRPPSGNRACRCRPQYPSRPGRIGAGASAAAPRVGRHRPRSRRAAACLGEAPSGRRAAGPTPPARTPDR